MRPPPQVLALPGPADPSRTPVVAVPGLGLSVEVPARTLRELQPVVRSTVVALPGYGVPRDGAAVDPASLGAELLRQLDGLHVRTAVLVGHSASCQIVAEAAAQDPGRVVGLVLVGPTTDPRAAGWPALMLRWLRTATWERPGQVPILVRDYHRTGFVDMSRAMDAARRHRIDRVVRTLSCPVLVVRGRHDRIAPGVQRDQVLVPGPALSRIGRAECPGSTHRVPLDGVVVDTCGLDAGRGPATQRVCARLRRSRTPRPSPRHAVHVGSRTIARQAGGTPRGTARPSVHPRHVESDLASPVLARRRYVSVRHFTSSNRSRPRRPVSIPPGGTVKSQNREQSPASVLPVTVVICDRCGDVVVGDAACRCATPYDEPAVRRRHQDAVARARASASDRRRRRRSNPAA